MEVFRRPPPERTRALKLVAAHMNGGYLGAMAEIHQVLKIEVAQKQHSFCRRTATRGDAADAHRIQ